MVAKELLKLATDESKVAAAFAGRDLLDEFNGWCHLMFWLVTFSILLIRASVARINFNLFSSSITL